ncbi:predicted protein [Histoplasma capsulatum H143]|uniref:NAD-dependent glutamate dehydrogenase N-terminal domain-containing protein n=1 Tax=Ajellomyces capsulatus (strain H143) TaxID=544712 RepID=C6HJC6_AJECH|nr:predicted protein [Histoplasma capsulatum H143]
MSSQPATINPTTIPNPDFSSATVTTDSEKPKSASSNGVSMFSRPVATPLSSKEGSGTGTPTTGFQRHPLVNKQLDMVIRTPGRQPSPQPTHLGIPGGTHRVLSEEGPGYVAAKFEGKKKQMEAVMDQLEEKGFIPFEFVSSETNWFYNMLGIDDMYFQTETVDAIAG